MWICHEVAMQACGGRMTPAGHVPNSDISLLRHSSNLPWLSRLYDVLRATADDTYKLRRPPVAIPHFPNHLTSLPPPAAAMTKRGSQKRKRRTTAASPEAQEPATATTASAEAPERAPKRARTFDERWKTATTSNEVVLGTCRTNTTLSAWYLTMYYTEKQMETWHSDVYEHFAMPPEIVLENGAVKYRFWCRK